MATRFQFVESDESEYSDEESDEKQRIEDRRQWFEDSSDEEEETRVVKTQKEKRWTVLQAHCTKIKNKLKILDYVETMNEYEELMKQIGKSENVVQAEGLPLFCIRTFVRLEDAINAVTKEIQKKMSTNNAKSFTKLKIHLKKNKIVYEERMAKFRANPVESESSESESVEEEVKKPAKKPQKGKKVSDEEEEEEDNAEDEDDDSEEWGEGSSEEEDDDEDSEEEASRPVDPQERRRFWEIKEKAKPDKKEEDRIKEEKEESNRKDIEKKEEDKKRRAVKQEVKEVKKEVITNESISAKLKEIIEKRTKKVSNVEVIVQELKVLLNHCKDQELTLQIVNLISLFEFENSKDTISIIMPRSIWLSLVEYTNKILDIFVPKYPVPENLDDTRKALILSLAIRVERLSNELIKAFKNLDAKASEYSQRLSDNITFSKLIKRAFGFYSTIQDFHNLAKIAELSIFQIHYIHDDVLKQMKENCKVDSAGYFFSISDSQKYVNDMAQIVFKHGDNLQKVLTGLMVSFHHALNGRFENAKTLFLQTNTNSLASDLSVQVYTNRLVVQLGLSAFYNGNISAAFTSLNEIVSTHRLKELLAQSIGINKDKTGIHEDRKRAVPYHMHINTDVVETVYFICAMLLDIPKMAMNPEDPEKFTLSRYFKRLMDFHERQASSGLTESFREFIIVATQKLRSGYWKEAYDVLENLQTWKHVPRSGEVKEKILEKLKQAGMLTYLLTYGNLYENFSKKQLSEKFEIKVNTVEKILNPLILSGEIEAFWDGDYLNLRVPTADKNDLDIDKKEKPTGLETTEFLNEFDQYTKRSTDGFKLAINKKKKQIRKLN